MTSGVGHVLKPRVVGVHLGFLTWSGPIVVVCSSRISFAHTYSRCMYEVQVAGGWSGRTRSARLVKQTRAVASHVQGLVVQWQMDMNTDRTSLYDTATRGAATWSLVAHLATACRFLARAALFTWDYGCWLGGGWRTEGKGVGEGAGLLAPHVTAPGTSPNAGQAPGTLRGLRSSQGRPECTPASAVGAGWAVDLAPARAHSCVVLCTVADVDSRQEWGRRGAASGRAMT